MSSKNIYIGIETRIHYEILESIIYDYLLSGILDKDKILNYIKQFTKGKNRSNKVLKHISVLITKNEPVLTKLSKSIDATTFSQLSPTDRKAMLLCLFCNSFPITYDIMIGFAQAFKAQPIVSKEVIIKKIGSVYGSNRAMYIAVTEILAFLIQCGFIVRVKLGIYSIGSILYIHNKVVSELLIYTDIKISGSRSILINELTYKPWYCYFQISNASLSKFNILLSNTDNSIGKGYLTIS
jgi:hypothetical protein